MSTTKMKYGEKSQMVQKGYSKAAAQEDPGWQSKELRLPGSRVAWISPERR